ncbi:hypothetical protein [Absidia glauca]|uniref:WH1 domain-containing protein n=1 Tax=Absidia glauca TaxID=4829 RepID=A0A163MKT7_ABSGL|nr:hypothetical protein [Absidia glauca]
MLLTTVCYFSSNQKILTSAVARLYVNVPHTNSWTYSQRWGAATFCKDKKKHNAFFIRIVDVEGHTGVLWEQELYNGFEYNKDKPFFHTFGTDDYLAGLEFVDEGEAEVFYKKVVNRESIRLKDDAANATNGAQWKISSRKNTIDKNHIGKPSDFRHLGHIGYTTDKGFTIENNDPEKNAIVDQLKALGITPEEINQNQDFIHQFLNKHTNTTSDNSGNAVPQSRSVPSSPVPNPPPMPSSNKTASASMANNNDDDGAAGGGDLASSLAAVLKQRQTAMQSDDEDDEDDDWE